MTRILQSPVCATKRAADRPAHPPGPGRDGAGPLREGELGGAERLLDVEEFDREAQLTAEKLRRGDVGRARRLEGAHRVDATGRKVAERESERAHDPEPVGEARD